MLAEHNGSLHAATNAKGSPSKDQRQSPGEHLILYAQCDMVLMMPYRVAAYCCHLALACLKSRIAGWQLLFRLCWVHSSKLCHQLHALSGHAQIDAVGISLLK